MERKTTDEEEEGREGGKECAHLSPQSRCSVAPSGGDGASGAGGPVPGDHLQS